MIERLAYNLRFVFALAAIAVQTMVASPDCFGQEKTDPGSTGWSFVFRVADNDGTLIKDATIKTVVNKTSDSHQQLPNGDFKITFDSKPKHFELRCKSDGKTPINATWHENDVPESSEEPFVVSLPTAIPTGGRIVDQEGSPVEGATVYVLAASDGQRLRPAISNFPCKTDGQGKWTCPVTPSNLNGLWIRLEHPEFISDQTYGGTVQNASIEELQAFKHVAVMRKGVTVSGTVSGPDQQPVPDAAVYQGSDRFGSHYPETKTDKDGKFTFKNCAEGEMVLTVVAKDLAPELVELNVVEGFKEPVNVELTRGKTLTIKVVDTEGNPVPKAWIPVDTWRGHRSLANAKLPSRTDKDGVFQWKHAPEDVVKCEVLVRGYLDHRGVEFTAREEPYIVKLVRPLVIKGSVVDAETGEPIESFRIVPQIHFREGEPGHPRRREAVDGQNGRYEFKVTYPRNGHSITIEAEGYATRVSNVFESDDGEVEFDFKLKKTPGISGTIVSEDGQPVKGAVVALSASPGYVRVEGGRITNLKDIPSTGTDGDGGFSLVSREVNWMLCVCHDLGFVVARSDDFKAGQTLKLLPWSVVTGKDLKSVGHKTPVMIALSESGLRGLSFTQYATVNSEGDFEFTKVAPGFALMAERIDPARPRVPRGHQFICRVTTKAGTRHQILLGQPGRKVVGKLAFEGRRIKAEGFAKAKTQQPDYPDGYDQWDEAKRQEWQKKWEATEEGMRFQTDRLLEYPLKFTGENRFEIEALPPGFYEISIQLGTDRGQSFLRTHRIRVKETSAQEKNPQPKDVGVIEFSHRD